MSIISINFLTKHDPSKRKNQTELYGLVWNPHIQ